MTDVSVKEQELLYVRVVDGGVPRMRFVSLSTSRKQAVSRIFPQRAIVHTIDTLTKWKVSLTGLKIKCLVNEYLDWSGIQDVVNF